MTAHVNDACIGCGLCTGVCPGVFTMTEEGVAAARDEIFPLAGSDAGYPAQRSTHRTDQPPGHIDQAAGPLFIPSLYD